MSATWVWIVGGGLLQTYAIRAAQQRGYKVLVTDGDTTCPGEALADMFVCISTNDIEQHRVLGRGLHNGFPVYGKRLYGKLAGVLTSGADCAPTVAAVAEELGVPGIPYPIACYTHNKLTTRVLQRSVLLAEAPAWTAILPKPQWQYGMSNADRDCLARTLPGWQAPQLGLACRVVIKPVQQRASRGVSLVQSPEHLPGAVARAMTAGEPGALLLAEEAVEGSEHSAELILNQDGAPCYFNLCDRYFQYTAGIPLELGHLNPSLLPEDAWQRAYGLMVRLADACGVRWGPFKADLVYTYDHHWKVLECTARLSGGFDSQLTVPLSTGRLPVNMVLSLAVGEPMPALDSTAARRPLPDQYACCLAVFPPPGRIAALPDEETCMALSVRPGVEHIIPTANVGDVIPPQLAHCAQRAGFVIATAPAPAQACGRAAEAREALAAAFQMEAV